MPCEMPLPAGFVRRSWCVAATLCALLGFIPAASAHDFWIEPSTFRPAAGQRFGVGLRVGDHFIGEAVPRRPDRLVKFIIAGPDGQQPIVGRDGSEPAGQARVSTPGVYVLGYRSNNAFVELEGPKFESYLAEKGLDAISQARRDAGKSAAKTREAYSRCSKSLICVGDGAPESAKDTPTDRELGFTLELIAEKNPYAAVANAQELPVRVMFQGKPLEGAFVTALRRSSGSSIEKLTATQPNQPAAAAPQPDFSARTDSSGRVIVPLNQPGYWLIAVVHMTPAEKGVDAEWQSYWASLTFNTGPAAAESTRPLPAAR